ncbi:hypothetical protein K32_49030 [Kaistia sp. 32K]|uniref:hypothetical protein n=1 Tax=Kaistia sp. 32K TaxID=2795690 RepID=UPI00191661DE|nr:hypothetical protein [Kaistia sp. 32K]BCP56286.1 hypothetical protein K32_49030 [Kaistia sp. 32K]
MKTSQESWIIKISQKAGTSLWVGNVQAAGRQDAKREAIRFVSEHLHHDTKILQIARGHIPDPQIKGEPVDFDSI